MALNENTVPTSENEQNDANEAEKFEYDGSRMFYGTSAEDIQRGAEFAQKVAETGLNVVYFQDNWPTGAGACFLPIQKTENGKRVLKGGVYWPYFPLETVQAHPAGKEYLADVVNADQATRILNPTRRGEWDGDVSSLPTTIEQHIEGMAADRGMVKAYTEAAKAILPGLRKMHSAFKHFTPQLLRQYLSSAAMARSFSADLEQKGFWLSLIDKLEAETKKAGGNVEIYNQWREHRNDDAEVDLSSLDIASLSL